MMNEKNNDFLKRLVVICVFNNDWKRERKQNFKQPVAAIMTIKAIVVVGESMLISKTHVLLETKRNSVHPKFLVFTG